MLNLLAAASIMPLATLLLLSPQSSLAHNTEKKDHKGDWGALHMEEEHHLYNFDPGAFFSLHDFNDDHQWSEDEILRTYGINTDTWSLVTDTGHDDERPEGHISEERRAHIVNKILGLMDYNNDKQISRDEFVQFCKEGGKLPDFGLGPGHHGDDEYEYEIHHYEKYHDENTKEEDLTHPEDIAHFKKHEQEHEAEEAFEKLQKQKVIEANIPAKFRSN